MKSSIVTLAVLFLAGCPKPVVQDTNQQSSVPELTLTVAALDLTQLNRRLTKDDVSDLWNVVKREKIEVVAIQNITRYPNVATRIDLVKEFGSLSDWRTMFGELVDNSGAQTGNAVFAAEFGRNLEYYSGLVFQIEASGGEEAIAGGGRYDGLLGFLGAPREVPAIGCALHTERLLAAVRKPA